MSWIKRRQLIISEIREMLKSKKDWGLDKENLISEIQIKYGSSRRTAIDYLKAAKSKNLKFLK